MANFMSSSKTQPAILVPRAPMVPKIFNIVGTRNRRVELVCRELGKVEATIAWRTISIIRSAPLSAIWYLPRVPPEYCSGKSAAEFVTILFSIYCFIGLHSTTAPPETHARHQLRRYHGNRWPHLNDPAPLLVPFATKANLGQRLRQL